MSYRLLVRALSQSNSVLLFLQKRLVRRFEFFTKSSFDGYQRQLSASLVRGSNRSWSKKRTVVASFHSRKTSFLFSSFFFFSSREKLDTDDRDSRAIPIGRGEARWRIIEFSCVLTKPCLVVKYYHVPWRKIAITLSTE